VRRPLAVALTCAVGLAAACGSDDPAPDASDETTTAPAGDPVAMVPEAVQHIELVGTEYAFSFGDGSADELQAGWTSLTFRNDGDEAHQVMFARLRDDVDPAEVAEAAAGDSSGGAAIEFVDMLGGVSYIGPGATIEAMVELPEGLVLAMCYVPDPDGVAHALSGMQTALTVGAADPPPPSDDDGDGAEPAQGTIELAADGYRIPSPLPAGWYRVANTDSGTGGQGLHELSIMRLDRAVAPDELDGLMEDLATNATPSVGVEAVGGLGAVSPGFEGYLYLDLPPGDYLAVDFMPDPRETRPHLLDGYYATFSP
jgi:hypothetical protein